MPNSTGKTVFAPTSTPEPTVEPVSGNSIIVIHPGSLHLRFGRASDTFPVQIPHCIARRHGRPGHQSHYEDAWLVRPEVRHTESAFQMLQGLNLAQEMLQSRPTSSGNARRATRLDQLTDFNKTSKAEVSEVMSNLHWTNTHHNEPFLIGQEALMVNPDNPYDLHWPVRRGGLNLHKAVGGTLSSVLQDLEDIWSTALCTYLKISPDAFKTFRAVLLIPDIYRRRHVRELTNLLLDRLGFEAAYVVQESVCATFGTGICSACVVDVGDQKVAVSCVEDGLSQPATRICMQFGGSDVSRCFHWLLTRSGFPYKDCDLSRKMDALFIQELKENFCHMEQDVQGAQDHQVLLRCPSQHIVKYLVRMGDERILAPMSVFFPDMFGLKGDHLYQKFEKFSSDPSDPNDDDYLIQTMSRHEQAARQRKKDSAVDLLNVSQENSLFDDAQMDDDDMMDQSDLLGKSQPEEESEAAYNMLHLIGIHEAIVMSIDRCDSDEMKKRMYSNVIVVGGGLMFPGFQSWLHHLLWIHMPANVKPSIEAMDIITRPKEMDPRMTCWKGGAIMCCLDTAQELWITGAEWTKYGVRVLRERAPFLW